MEGASFVLFWKMWSPIRLHIFKGPLIFKEIFFSKFKKYIDSLRLGKGISLVWEFPNEKFSDDTDSSVLLDFKGPFMINEQKFLEKIRLNYKQSSVSWRMRISLVIVFWLISNTIMTEILICKLFLRDPSVHKCCFKSFKVYEFLQLSSWILYYCNIHIFLISSLKALLIWRKRKTLVGVL